MAKQAITLKIAGKSYPFNIESGKEEIYRLAEREVNSYLALIKQQHIKNWNDQDYLAMAALKFAIANVGMRQSREIDSEDMKQLEKIGTEIDGYLNTLKPGREGGAEKRGRERGEERRREERRREEDGRDGEMERWRDEKEGGSKEGKVEGEKGRKKGEQGRKREEEGNAPNTLLQYRRSLYIHRIYPHRFLTALRN